MAGIPTATPEPAEIPPAVLPSGRAEAPEPADSPRVADPTPEPAATPTEEPAGGETAAAPSVGNAAGPTEPGTGADPGPGAERRNAPLPLGAALNTAGKRVREGFEAMTSTPRRRMTLLVALGAAALAAASAYIYLVVRQPQGRKTQRKQTLRQRIGSRRTNPDDKEEWNYLLADTPEGTPAGAAAPAGMETSAGATD